MKVIEFVTLLLRIAVAAGFVVLWRHTASAARANGRLLRALSRLFGALAIIFSWYLIIALNTRWAVFDPTVGEWMQTFGLLAWIPLAVTVWQVLCIVGNGQTERRRTGPP